MARVDNPVIGFIEEDAQRLHHSHDDALIVSIQVSDYNTYRVLVDNGSSTDILYYPAFQQMRIEKERLIPTNAPRVGFGGTRGVPIRCGHPADDSQRLPSVNHEGHDLPGR